MRFSGYAAGLFAAAAMFFLAPAARAEFVLQVKVNDTGEGFKIAGNTTDSSFTVTKLGGYKGTVTYTASGKDINASATIDNYTFKVHGTSNQDVTPTPKEGRIGFDATVTAGSNAKAASFTYYVTDNPFTFPGKKGDKLYMKTQLYADTLIKGDLVKASTTYTDYATGKPAINHSTDTLKLQDVGSKTSNTVSFVRAYDQYAISNVGGGGELKGKLGTLHFRSYGITALPEPTGVLIGLIGLPCMGLVVFFARRRASGLAAVAA